MRLSLFTKNEKSFYLKKKKTCASNDYLLCRKAIWIIFFILLVNRQNRFFSTFVSFWKNSVAKNVLSANLAIPGLQLGGLGRVSLSSRDVGFTGSEVAGVTRQSTIPGLPVVLAREQARRWPGTCTGWSFAWQSCVENRCRFRIIDYHATKIQKKKKKKRLNIYSNGFPIQFEVNRNFVFSVSPWLVLLVIL